QVELVDFCHKKGIAVTAYAPLGSPGNTQGQQRLLDEPVVNLIAKAHKKTPAQVLIRWSIQRGIVTIPKSATPERIGENFDIFDFKLTSKEIEQLNSLNKNHRYIDPVGVWGIPYFR